MERRLKRQESEKKLKSELEKDSILGKRDRDTNDELEEGEIIVDQTR